MAFLTSSSPTFLALLLFLSIISFSSSQVNHALCNTDKDCEKLFPGTICVEVLTDTGISSSENVRKCVPSSDTRPACRGSSRGLCPEYQSPENNYLNSVCTFQSADDLGLDANSTKLCKPGDVSENCFFQYTSKIDNDTVDVLGKYVCVDLSACPLVSAFPDTCESAICSTGEKQMCNNQGTCTLGSYTKTNQNTCTCYAGFSGAKCEKTVSGECDIGCGAGGECINGMCKCKANWNGNSRCTKCTNDSACENGGTCDKGPNGTGKCICPDGYVGATCGGRLHDCVGVDCGKGICSEGVCYCPVCSNGCTKCKDNTCKECPKTLSSSSQGFSNKFSILMVVVSIVVGYFIFN